MLLYFDGDDVGSAIEVLLLDGKLEEAAAHSRRVTKAVQELASRLEADLGAHVLFAAGDELLADVDGQLDHHMLTEIRDAFHFASGCTVSVGMGESPFAATVNLRRAKLIGKNSVVEGHGSCGGPATGG